jgi:hypothetical protein
MIQKSGHWLSEMIMLDQEASALSAFTLDPMAL